MKILALDTALSACSVALWCHSEVRTRRWVAMERGQSEALMPMVDEVMKEADETFFDLDLVAVTAGPGAFTGIRIGLAAARGIALAADLPCLGVTTLEAVAHGVGSEERRDATVLVVLDAKRSDVYAQAFTADLNPLGEARALLAPQLVTLVGKTDTAGRRLVVVGNAAPMAVEALTDAGITAAAGSAPGVPDAAIVAAMAAVRWRPGTTVDIPGPLYLRPPDATLPRAGGRRRP